MRRVVFSTAARTDLFSIWDFISADSVAAADRVIAAIETAASRLAESPGLGHARSDVSDQQIRFWRVYSYLIVYRFDDEELNVIRVTHVARDLRTLLDSTDG